MAIRSIVVGLLTLMPFLPDARAADCTCRDLAALQAELRNAIRLESRFRAQIGTLRTLAPGASQGAVRQFAEGEARQGLEPRPGGGPAEVDYVPYGASVAVENLDRLEPGQTPQQRQEQLCAMSAASATALAAAVRGAACDAIGEALRAHEAIHVQMCRSIGYRAYLAMHGADRAAEEAEGYGAQIVALRAAIFRLIEGANARLEVTANSRAAMQNNPVWRAILNDVRADIAMTRVGPANPRAGTLRFEGQGQQRVSVRIEGNCRFVAGDSMTLPATAAIETDGLEARVEYTVAGTSPTMRVVCGQGWAMSIPVAVAGSLPPGVALPLRQPMEHVADMATVPAAAMLAAGGIQLTGQSRVRVTLAPGAGAAGLACP